MKNNTLLFITSRLPFPATSGRKTSLYNYCKIIKDYGYKIIVASFDDKTDLNLKPDFIDEVIILPNPGKITKLSNLLINSFIKRKYPMQVSLYWDKKIDIMIKDIVSKYSPSIVIGDMVRTTEYLKNLGENIYTVADLDDRLSLRYERQLECDVKNVNPYGLFLSTLPNILQKLLLINFVKTSVMKNEIKLLKKYELDIGKSTDVTVFVAEEEANNFNRELGEDKAIAIPIGVDIEYFKKIDITKKDNYIGFLGVLNVSHNENAVKKFINDIFPLVKKEITDAKFLVIGGGASDNLKSYENDSIIFTGRVDDVRDYLNKCKLFVCPLMFGSGIKTKNLEAMSLGIPVVTTSVGAENINAVDGKDWFVADDDRLFAKNVVKLLKDDNLGNKIGNSGSLYVSKHFTWDVAHKKFKKILKR